MNLEQLIQGLPLVHVAGPSPADVAVTDLTDDSRRVGPGCLLIVRSGGEAYVAEAVGRGPAAVIAPPSVTPVEGVCWLQCDAAAAGDQGLAGTLADRFFGEPSRRLKLVGVTGTKGKTTTAILVQHLLAAAGLKCGLIGTIFIDDGSPGKPKPAELTTPGAIEFVRLLRAMVDHGCRAAVAEVSSHALHQKRVAAMQFAVAVFTNLTGDHLDYHKTMDAYADAKAILLESLGPQAWAVINADDVYTQRMLDAVPRHARMVATTLTATEGRCSATPITLAADHSIARYAGPWGSFELKLPLVGRHNISNVLQAIAAANCVTAMARTLRDAMASCPTVPGRLEPVRGGENTPTVLVDYAHTHDSLEKTLLALRPVTKGKLITLFGCGGDRDKTKRPKMAAVACKLADRVVITSDNPRTEDPQAIIADILAGVPEGLPIADCRLPNEGHSTSIGNRQSAIGNARVFIEPDRAEAIRIAVNLADPADTVLVAGKGHEDYQIIGKTKRHFDDREHAAEALRTYRHPVESGPAL